MEEDYSIGEPKEEVNLDEQNAKLQQQASYDYNDNSFQTDNTENVSYEKQSFLDKLLSLGTKTLLIIIGGVVLLIIIIAVCAKSCGGAKLTDLEVVTDKVVYMNSDNVINVRSLGKGKRIDTVYKFDVVNDKVAMVKNKEQRGVQAEAIVNGLSIGNTVLNIRASLGNKSVTKKVNLLVCGNLQVGGVANNTISVEVKNTKKIDVDLGSDPRCYAGLTYTFSDETIAKMANDNEVQGISEGETELIISDGANEIKYLVNVTDPTAKIYANSITVTPAEILMYVGDTKQITDIVFEPADVTSKDVTWTSYKPTVASVTPAGLIAAVKEGTATIRVDTLDGSNKYATIQVKVIKPDGDGEEDNVSEGDLLINLSSTSVTVGQSVTATIGFSSNNASKITVENLSTAYIALTQNSTNAYTITGLAVGTATIKATSADKKTASATINVVAESSIDDGVGGGGSSGDEDEDEDEDTYVLMVNPNGGIWDSKTSTASFTLKGNDTKLIAPPTKTNYYFAGWEITGSGYFTGIPGMGGITSINMNSSNNTLNAMWKSNETGSNDEKTFTLNVNPNGGIWGGKTSISSFTLKGNGTKYIVPPTRTGYSFDGWKIAGSGYFAGSPGMAWSAVINMNSSNNTLNAIWKSNGTVKPTDPVLTKANIKCDYDKTNRKWLCNSTTPGAKICNTTQGNVWYSTSSTKKVDYDTSLTLGTTYTITVKASGYATNSTKICRPRSIGSACTKTEFLSNTLSCGSTPLSTAKCKINIKQLDKTTNRKLTDNNGATVPTGCFATITKNYVDNLFDYNTIIQVSRSYQCGSRVKICQKLDGKYYTADYTVICKAPKYTWQY